MFLITSGTLGWAFAVAKTIAAVSIGLFGGFATMLAAKSVVFADPLREQQQSGGGCCSNNKPLQGKPHWRFWQDSNRRTTFGKTAATNGLFLLKWLALAYVIEALMLKYIPAEAVASLLGGTGITPIILGALIGAPGVSERLCRRATGRRVVGTRHERWRRNEFLLSLVVSVVSLQPLRFGHW